MFTAATQHSSRTPVAARQAELIPPPRPRASHAPAPPAPPVVAARAAEGRPAESRAAESRAVAEGAAPAVQLSIGGERATVVEIDQETLAVHTGLRLCPGRRVNVRVGGTRSTAATIASSRIHALLADGPVYIVRLALMQPLTELIPAAQAAVA